MYCPHSGYGVCVAYSAGLDNPSVYLTRSLSLSLSLLSLSLSLSLYGQRLFFVYLYFSLLFSF